ncbi:MAG: GTP-binding protein [Sulfurimonas sp.]|nr:MAG: GTP-binding protein [Sulfurimonas sp.]
MEKYIKKILIIGNHGVGKTSLATRYVDNKFSDAYLSTIGVNIMKKNLILTDHGNIAAVALMLWDIEGANKNQNVPLHYAKGCNAFIVVVDITREETQQNLQQHLEYIHRFSADIPFIIAINKSDLEGTLTLNNDAIQRKYRNCVGIVKTSAKEDANVDALFTTITKHTIWQPD